MDLLSITSTDVWWPPSICAHIALRLNRINTFHWFVLASRQIQTQFDTNQFKNIDELIVVLFWPKLIIFVLCEDLCHVTIHLTLTYNQIYKYFVSIFSIVFTYFCKTHPTFFQPIFHPTQYLIWFYNKKKSHHALAIYDKKRSHTHTHTRCDAEDIPIITACHVQMKIIFRNSLINN